MLFRRNRKNRSHGRRLRFEKLDSRQLMAADLHNPLVSEDVNDDGAVSAIDVLQVINYLNQAGSQRQDQAPASASRLSYVDVSGDGEVAPLDALLVVNRLNAPAVQRPLETVFESNGLIRGRVDLDNAAVVSAKAKINQGAPFDLKLDSSGSFTIDVTKFGITGVGAAQVTMYLTDATEAVALRQLTIDLSEVSNFNGDAWIESESGIKAQLSEGLLTVLGTDSDDHIFINEVGELLDIDGFLFPLTEIKTLAVDAGSGNDEVTIEGSIKSRDIITLVDGGAGDDFISSNFGSGVLFGGPGNDSIWGGELDDFIAGGEGNDSVFGNAGHDRIDGGEGDDFISGGEQDDAINGGAGNDQIWGHEGIDLLDGDEGDDLIWGGSDGDIINGGSGNDLIHGGTGDDRIVSGEGRDTIFGDSDNDWLDGGASGDFIYGGAGDDTIQGGSGSDEIRGEDGDDYLNGGSHDDRIFGGDGNDTLRGGTGDDELWGESGDDVLDGDEGERDKLHGGFGYDKFYGVSVLLGWAGFDTWDDEGGGWYRSSRSIDGDYNSLDILVLGLWAGQVSNFTTVPNSPVYAPPAVVPGFATSWNIPFESVISTPAFPTTGGIGESIYRSLTPYLGNATVERLVRGMVPTSIGNPPLP